MLWWIGTATKTASLSMQINIITSFLDQVTFEVFLRLTEKDLENMDITAVGVRKSILQAIKEINKKEWQTSSLPNVALNTHMT